MRTNLVLLAVLCGFARDPQAAHSQEVEHRLHLSKYEPVLIAGFPLTPLLGAKLYHPDTSYLEREGGWKNPLDAGVRSLLHDRIFQNREGIPQIISDQIRNATILYPLLYFPRKSEPRYEFHGQPFAIFADARFLLSYAEAHGLTFLVTNLTKFLANRQRPWVAYRNFDAPLYRNADATHGNVSFFSGHTSAAFVAASFHHRMLQRFQGRHFGDAQVWSLYLAATLTGMMRISADKHHFTDVLVGAVAGTALTRWVVDLSDYEIVDKDNVQSLAHFSTFPIIALRFEF